MSSTSSGSLPTALAELLQREPFVTYGHVIAAGTVVSVGLLTVLLRRKRAKSSTNVLTSPSIDGGAATYDILTGVFPSDVKLVTHRGSCHCGGIKILVRSPADVCAVSCTCGLCVCKGRPLLLVVPGKCVSFPSGTEGIGLYKPTALAATPHMFCTTCGIHLLNLSRANSTAYEINVGCLAPGTIKSVTAYGFDGANWDVSFAALKAEKEADIARSASVVVKPAAVFEPRPELEAVLEALHDSAEGHPTKPPAARSAPRRDTASSEEPRAPLPSSGFTTPVSTRSPDGNPRVHPAVSVRPATLLETPPVDHKSVTSVVSTGARSAATVPSSAASAIEAGRRPFDASPQPEDDDDGFDSDSTDSETANITRQALRRDTGAAHRTSLTATRPRRSPAEAVTTRLASSKPSF